MKKLTKRIITMLLCFSILVPVAACGGNEADSSKGSSSSEVSVNDSSNSSKDSESETSSPSSSSSESDSSSSDPQSSSDSSSETESSSEETVYEYSLNFTSFELEAGKTKKLIVNVDPEKEVSPVWSTSDAAIAAVGEDGTVTAVKAGTATITAAVDGETLACTVTVTPKKIEYAYELDQTTLNLKPGTTARLNVIVTPEKEVAAVWSSSQTSVATVSSTGLVEATGLGTAVITAEVEGHTLTCTVSVTSDVTATVASIAAEGDIDLNDCDDTLDTLYWEHYQEQGTDCRLNTTDYILSNSIESTDRFFYDYAAKLSWTNGSNITAWGGNTNGSCMGSEVAMEIKVNPSVKAIRLFTGAWRATNTSALFLNGIQLAESEPFTAGESSVGKIVTFALDVKSEQTVTIKITPSDLGEAGNVSLTAVAVLGTADSSNVTTALALTKTEMTGVHDNHINLTEKGTKDWFYLNYEHNPDQMKDGAGIDVSSLKVESDGKFWDYKAAFNWTNGKVNETSPVDGDCDNQGTNNGKCGAYVAIDVLVNAETSHVFLYVGGWQSTYYMQAVDSKGNIIFNEKMHDEVNGQTFAYEADFAVTASAEEKITFIIYRTTGSNCSLAAVAVS